MDARSLLVFSVLHVFCLQDKKSAYIVFEVVVRLRQKPVALLFFSLSSPNLVHSTVFAITTLLRKSYPGAQGNASFLP